MSSAACLHGARSSPALFVMVGLPAAGKTARAKEVPDEAERRSSETASPPSGHSGGSSWVSERRPSSVP